MKKNFVKMLLHHDKTQPRWNKKCRPGEPIMAVLKSGNFSDSNGVKFKLKRHKNFFQK